jgi:cardiolipin synthase
MMTIGALALGTLVMNLFSEVGERPRRAKSVGSCAVGSVDFLLAVAGVTNAPIRRGGTARLLNNGDEFVPAMLDAIRGAERSINFATYIWRDGCLSERFFEALIDAAARGVEVRVLVDGLGGLLAPRGRIAALRRAGGQWEPFHPLRFGMLTRLHKRLHRRALVIDGRVGFTGGASIMDKWLGSARGPGEWRDCMVEVRGPPALGLQAAFTQIWAHATGEMLSGPAFYPADCPAGELRCFDTNEVGLGLGLPTTSRGSATGKQAAGKRNTNGPLLNDNDTGDRGVASPDEAVPAASYIPIAHHINFVGSPSSESHPMRNVFWLTIRCSRDRIWIASPYFVPDNLLAAALKERARAGLDVRVLLPNEHNDLAVVRWASRSYYRVMLDAGVRIFEFQPTMIHQKLLVADGVWSLVGSANMDVRSKELNQENAIGIHDREFAARLEAVFLEDLAHSREIDRREWRRRFWARRLWERFVRVFEEQF